MTIATLVTIAVLLFIKGLKDHGDWLLIWLAAAMLGMAIIESITPYDYYWESISVVLKLSIGPLLIAYIHFKGKLRLVIPWWAFAVLPVTILSFLIYALLVGMSEIEFYSSPITLSSEFIAFVVSVAYGIYATLAFEKMKHGKEEIDPHLRTWMVVLIACFLTEILIQFIYLFVYAIADDSVYLWLTDSLISASIVLTLFLLGLRTKVLFRPKARDDEANGNRWQALYETINTKVREEQLFLQHDLRVDDLARIMESNSKYVSRAINEGAGQSVTNYLNDLRLDYFKSKLRNDKNAHINLFALAEECGFSSKSSFNRYFKLKEGMTPSEYREDRK